MNVIYILIPIAIAFVVFGLTVFFWAVRKGQFDDLEKQGFSILFDDNSADIKPKNHPATKNTTNNQQANK